MGILLSEHIFSFAQDLPRYLTGTELVSFTQEILEAAEQEAFALYEETAAENAAFKAIDESWKAFRQKVYQWNRINELGFSTFAMRSP